MPEPKVTTVTREHRAEAARLLGFEPAPSGSLHDVFALKWIVGDDVPDWWFERHEQGFSLPPVAQALADRDARIGELERKLEWEVGGNRDWKFTNDKTHAVLASERALLDTTKAQLARVVGALRALRHDVCGSPGCASRELRTRVDSILKELDHA